MLTIISILCFILTILIYSCLAIGSRADDEMEEYFVKNEKKAR